MSFTVNKTKTEMEMRIVEMEINRSINQPKNILRALRNLQEAKLVYGTYTELKWITENMTLIRCQ